MSHPTKVRSPARVGRLAIVHPGLLTTVQDLGRREMLKYALSMSGAMDQTSVRLINLLLGNPETAAVLETTMMGLKLRALTNLKIAVGGADQGLSIKGSPAPLWTVTENGSPTKPTPISTSSVSTPRRPTSRCRGTRLTT